MPTLTKLFSVHYWKTLFARILAPLLNLLIRLRISPNLLTLLAFASALTSVYHLFNNQTLFIAFMLLNLLLDVLDGQLARVLSQSSSLGDRLDKISDNTFGLLLFLKAYFHLANPLALLGLTFYILHMLLAGRGWRTLFGPSTTLLRVLFAFKLYTLSLLLQTLYAPFALIAVHAYYRLKPFK